MQRLVPLPHATPWRGAAHHAVRAVRLATFTSGIAGVNGVAKAAGGGWHQRAPLPLPALMCRTTRKCSRGPDAQSVAGWGRGRGWVGQSQLCLRF